MRSKPLVLAINAGSSTLKASILRGETHLATFLAERLDTDDAVVHYHVAGHDPVSQASQNMDHALALQTILQFLGSSQPQLMNDLVAVGHRVVHGGSRFTSSVIVDEQVLEEIDAISHLAPL